MKLKDCLEKDRHFICRGHGEAVWKNQMSRCCLCSNYSSDDCLALSTESSALYEQIKKEVQEEVEFNKWLKRDEDHPTPERLKIDPNDFK